MRPDKYFSVSNLNWSLTLSDKVRENHPDCLNLSAEKLFVQFVTSSKIPRIPSSPPSFSYIALSFVIISARTEMIPITKIMCLKKAKFPQEPVYFLSANSKKVLSKLLGTRVSYQPIIVGFSSHNNCLEISLTIGIVDSLISPD